MVNKLHQRNLLAGCEEHLCERPHSWRSWQPTHKDITIKYTASIPHSSPPSPLISCHLPPFELPFEEEEEEDEEEAGVEP